MPRKDLIDYIDHELNRGIHIDRIKQSLFEVGHKIEHVDDALIFVNKRKKRRLYTFVSIMIIVLLILIVGVILLLDNFKKDTEEFDDDFYFGLALEELNDIHCQKIVDELRESSCIHNVKVIKAVEVPQFELDDREFYKEAIETKNPEICNNIQGKIMKENCLEQAR